MTFYIGIFFTSCILLVFNSMLKSEKDKRILAILAIVALCIISGTRYNLGGSDYFVYQNMYQVVPKLDKFHFANVHDIYGTFGAEKGYLFLNSIMKTIGITFYGFTLIHSIVFYSLLYISVNRYAYNFQLIIVVFLYKLFFYNTFISMRQSITIAIFFYAMKFIEEKKSVKYFISCIIALFFHNGALILFVVYFINKFTLTKKRLVLLNCIFIPTIIFSLLHIPIMNIFGFVFDIFSNPTAELKAEGLLNSVIDSSLGVFHTLEYFLIMALVIFNYTKVIKVNRHVEFVIKLFLCLLPIMTLFRGYEMLTRIKDYFTITYGIILGYLCLIDDKRYSTIIQIGTVLVCAFGFFRFIILFDDGALTPYQSYLFKGVDIFV